MPPCGVYVACWETPIYMTLQTLNTYKNFIKLNFKQNTPNHYKTLLPHRAAHRISDPKRFLYLRISGVSPKPSVVCEGVTLTLICEPRRDCFDIIEETEPMVEPSAPNPNAEKDLWCFIAGGSTALLY